VLDWLTFYNAKRPHSTLDDVSPMAFENKRLAEKSKLVA
jgi:transposase InsO family protein